ncbi:Card1-like endonuclease domain-containing protein [Anaerotignum sp.]
MKVLIEYYDKDVLKNIVAPLTLQPDVVVYLHDKGMTDKNVFRSLKTCFAKSMPNIKLESIPVDIRSVEKLRQATFRVAERYGAENCTLELTGGSELMMIAGYKAGLQTGMQMVHTDLVNRCINNVETDEKVCDTVTLTLENFLDAKGAELMGESHRPPQPERYEDIKRMAQFLFRNLQEWKVTCSWLQTVVSWGLPHELHLDSKRNVHMKNGKPVAPVKEILFELQRRGFIKHLEWENDRVSFDFRSIEDKQYCISYGVWLELHVYVAAASSGAFEDVKLGTMIDWDIYDGTRMGGNEIDVVLMDDSLPVFISCKLREADTAALNELLIAKKRLGGWFSKGLIATFSKEKQENTGTYMRCQDLGLEMLDARDILAEDFSDRLVRAIREHDLVSLKWKKV